MDSARRDYYLRELGMTPYRLRGAEPEEPVAEAEPIQVSEAESVEEQIQPAGTGNLPTEELDWTPLEKRVSGCTLCELHKSRTQTVFGVGPQDAGLLIIGEGPGAEEDKRGEPFIGRAGKLLDKMLFAIGYSRSPKKGEQGAYIANVVKCRPPNNRDPRPEESGACRPYLDRQIELLKPKLIVAVGRIAAQNLLDTAEPLGKMRDRRYEYAGIPVLVTYHPAYLLRSPKQKGKSWADLKQAKRLLDAA